MAGIHRSWGLGPKDRPIGEARVHDGRLVQEATQPAPYGAGSITIESWSGDRPFPHATLLSLTPLYDVSTRPWPVTPAQAQATADEALRCMAAIHMPPLDASAFVPVFVEKGPGPHAIVAGSPAYSFELMAEADGRCSYAEVQVDAITGAVLEQRLHETAYC